MKDGIFICYKRKDSAALAGRVHDFLHSFFPNRVFMDVQNIMPENREWPESIRSLCCHQALKIRTNCFLRDITPLRPAVCQACTIVPPTLWESFLTSLLGITTIDERTHRAGPCTT